MSTSAVDVVFFVSRKFLRKTGEVAYAFSNAYKSLATADTIKKEWQEAYPSDYISLHRLEVV